MFLFLYKPDKLLGDYQLWQTFRDTNINPEESLNHGRPVWEYEVLDEKSAFVFVFYLGKNRIPHEDMEKVFQRVLHEEESTSDFHNTVVSELKHGWYPSGGPHSQQVTGDRVLLLVLQAVGLHRAAGVSRLLWLTTKIMPVMLLRLSIRTH